MPKGYWLATYKKIENKLKLETSVYAAVKTRDRLYVGGSSWNRRNKLYSKKIAKESKGILHIFHKKGTFYD